MTNLTKLDLIENILKEKELIEYRGVVVISSRTLAKALGKKHNNVIRDIENIFENSENSYLSYLIIPSTYKVEGQNRAYKEYLLTKNGFILYMFNIQGYVDFKMNYILKYDLMEEFISSKNIQTEFEQYVNIALNKLEPQIKEIENKLENQIRIDYGQQRFIQKKINCKIELEYNGFLLVNSKSKRSWYMTLYKGIKDKFQVASYRDLKQKDFDKCVEFINDWIPPKYLFDE